MENQSKENLGGRDPPPIPKTFLGKPRPREIPTGQIFEVLSNERRRLVLRYLSQKNGESTDLRPLVDFVAAEENGTTSEELDSNARKRVYTALRQSHLPKLHDIGVIEYDRLRGQVALSEAAREVQPYLDYFPNSPLKWSLYYLVLTGVGAAAVVLFWLGVGPFAGMSEIAVAIFLLLLFAIGSINQTVYSMLYERARLPSM